VDAFYGLITADFEWLPALPGAVAELAAEDARSSKPTSST